MQSHLQGPFLPCKVVYLQGLEVRMSTSLGHYSVHTQDEDVDIFGGIILSAKWG